MASGLLGLSLHVSELPGAAPASALDAGDRPSATPPHHVTPGQLVDANGMIPGMVDGLEAVAGDGRRLNWAAISGGRPVVLVFIKDGCPCSVQLEPFFQGIERLYRGEARFADVIDGDLGAARRYAAEQHVPYPVLADADRMIIRRLRAKNGGYVSLLGQNGEIVGYWPGSSADALRDLGRRIAALGGVAERPLDVRGAPNALTTGCPFGP